MKILMYSMAVIVMSQLSIGCDSASHSTKNYEANVKSVMLSTDSTIAQLPEEKVTDKNSFNTEEYDNIVENPFVTAEQQPLSTFSIDVDRAAYSNVRRYITEGALPPRGAVRIEEMINYFNYTYPQPQNGEPFSVNTEIATCPWNEHHRLVHIGLKGKDIDKAKLPPANLVFLIDVSGSMEEPNKLPLVQSSLKMLTSQLREKDRVAIVTYAGNAGLV